MNYFHIFNLNHSFLNAFLVKFEIERHLPMEEVFMKNNFTQKIVANLIFLTTLIIPILSYANKDIHPSVTPQILEKARANDYWKKAFITGKHAQIVFMNVSPMTNSNNEIGMETHPFDQVIMIAQGNGKSILNGKKTIVETGDLIFIPKGTKHNVVNLNQNEGLKIISIYSATDIPAGSAYKKKVDETK